MKHRTLLTTVAGGAVLALCAAAPVSAGTIHNRQERQQQRIAQGVASGQLTARETARLEGREAGLNHEIHAMRRTNGGTLTPSERALVEHQQNRLSRSIYRQKHDGQTR
ncbi:MAG: hypothetical protein ACM3NW_08800 [Syntrophomonadaceae bacterium]